MAIRKGLALALDAQAITEQVRTIVLEFYGVMDFMHGLEQQKQSPNQRDQIPHRETGNHRPAL